MEKIELYFTAQYLLIDDMPPKNEHFKSFEEEFQHICDNTDDATYYSIRTKLTNEYFWLYASFGKPNPRPENVLNTENLCFSDNPRKPNEVEQDKQLFIVYNFVNSTMYLSNIKQKGFIKNLIEKITNKDINIKDIYKTLEDFYNAISQISQICFTSKKKDLFSKFNSINEVLADNYGMDEPEEFRVEAKYHTPLTQSIKSIIQKLRGDEHLKQIIIQGRDDQGFEKIFNNDTFTQKIPIKIEKNIDGMLSELKVRDAILFEMGLKC